MLRITIADPIVCEPPLMVVEINDRMVAKLGGPEGVALNVVSTLSFSLGRVGVSEMRDGAPDTSGLTPEDIADLLAQAGEAE